MDHDHVDGHSGVIRSAFFYDLMLAALTYGREKTFRENTLDNARISTGDRVLDVGCGTGTLALAAKRRVGTAAEVHGVDASDEMIGRARAKATRRRVAVSFEVASAEKLPFADASFDVVLSSLMLHHLPQTARKQAVAEMMRVLKPGGRLDVVVELIQQPMLRYAFIPKRLQSPHDHSHSYVEAKELMTSAGFRELGAGSFQWRYAAWVLGEAGRIGA